ncbi:MAG: peptide ABC transporter permease, partial [Candidatus Omnitrophica bacterium]|nr:peptide ABC transporter permease [Candidatus Omnitrophota bacterium]
MKSNRLKIGMAIIGIFALLAIAAPLVCPYDPSVIDQGNLLMPPSARHLLGTDGLGRDLMSRIIFGARISLSIGLIAVGISVVIGLIFGSISGFYGGLIDSAIMRFVDIMLCFP